MRILVFFLFFLNALFVQAGSYRKAAVQPALKKQLKKIVELSKDLHEASYTSDHLLMSKKMADLSIRVKKIKESLIAKNQTTLYLQELLNKIETSLKQAMEKEGLSQKKALQVSFLNITRVSQGFEIGNYRTFYCPENKELWIQRSWLVKNPIRPKSRCGVLVN